MPCYGALFGPQLFGHGTKVESHKSFGKKEANATQPKNLPGPNIQLSHIENKLKTYNDHFSSKSLEVKSREVNGRVVLEGALRIYWGIQGMIHLKEDDDQRTVVTIRKRNSVRYPNSVDMIRNSQINADQVAASDNDTTISESLSYDTISVSSDLNSLSSGSAPSSTETSPAHHNSYTTLPSKLDVKQIEWDEIDELLQVERNDDFRSATLPLSLSTTSMTDSQISAASLELDSEYKTLSPDGESTSQSSSIYYSQMESSSTTTNGMSQVDDDDSPTLKPCDFDDFKKQMSEEFVNGTNEMPHSSDGTLKANQPIDISRINDSLKLYSDMNRSVTSEDGLSMYSLSNSFSIPGQIKSFNIQDTLNQLKKDSSSSSSDDKTLRHDINKVTYKKSISSDQQSTATTDDACWSAKGVARSKSGPNHALNHQPDFESDTVKPSKKPPTSISIKMDCYDEIKGDETSVNGGASSEMTTSTFDEDGTDDVVLRRKHKGSTAIKRRSGNRR